MQIKNIFKSLHIKKFPENLEIYGIAVDSRKVKTGDLFFAFSGAHTDGNLYINEAAAKGAAAVITESNVKNDAVAIFKVDDINKALADCVNTLFNNPSSELEIIGITGTNGKTTTAYMLESIYKLADRKIGVIGTINYRINGKITGKAVNTTPHALMLNSFMTEMLKQNSETLILEVSSHALSLKRVDGIDFDTAVFMNLSRDHLDFHKTADKYFLAKKKLFEMLTKSVKRKKLALLNGDDNNSSRIKTALNSSVQCVLFGMDSSNEWRAKNITQKIDGISFTLDCPQGIFDINLQLTGEYNVYNALASISCAVLRGINIQTAIKGVQSLKGIAGRMESIKAGQDFYVFIDFAHTDSALKKVLKNLNKVRKGKRIFTVFGCGGDRYRSKRRTMGIAACANSSHVFITTDNPRTENPSQIFNDIKKGIKEFTNYTIIPDRRKAVYEAIKQAHKDDIVLIAGKGHEEGQLIKNKIMPYNDRKTAEDAIRERDGI